MQAASQNGHVDVLKLLLKHNVDLEAEVCIASKNTSPFTLLLNHPGSLFCFFIFKFIVHRVRETRYILSVKPPRTGYLCFSHLRLKLVC